MHVNPQLAAIAQLPLQPDVVVGDPFIGIELRHQRWIDSVDLAIDGLIAAPEHRIALKAAQSHTIEPAIGLALSPCQQMMGGSA